MGCCNTCGLISNCPVWFTPLPLWTNDCNEQTLPAASSCLVSLILYIMGGFLIVDTCPFIPQDKANLLIHGPTQLKIDNQQSVMVWTCNKNAKIPTTIQSRDTVTNAECIVTACCYDMQCYIVSPFTVFNILNLIIWANWCLNQKNTHFLSFYLVWSSSVVPHIRCCDIMEPNSIARLSGD